MAVVHLIAIASKILDLHCSAELLAVHPLVLAVLPLLYLFILEVGYWQNVLEQVVKENERIELQIGVFCVRALERLADALDYQLSDVEAVVADQVHLHQLGVDTRLRLPSVLLAAAIRA